MKLSLFTLLSLALLTACAAEPSPQVKQAEQLRKSGQTAEALSLLRGAQMATPDDPLLLEQLGLTLLDANQPQEATRIFDHLITLSSGNALAYSGKGIAADRMNDHAAAQKFYAQALAIAPDKITVRNNLALSLILDKRYEEAITLLEKIRAEKRDNKTIRQNLAMAYALSGNKPKALELNLLDLTPTEAKKKMRSYTKSY